jgi:UDP-N-acetylmuramoyl-tripeptide--D-alanyl-D-alanine ligase
VLSQKYSVVTNEGNLNSETGLPLSVFKIRAEHEVGIFEMGMNRRGEISEIASVLFPSIAVITNIGTAHIGILGTQDAIAEEKKQIFSNFSENCIGFVPENDKYASFLQKVKKGRIEKYGIKSNRKIREVSSSGLDGTTFEYDGVFIRFPVPGKHNFSNALAAISVAEYLHLSTAEIKKGLESVKTIFGRSQIYRGEKTLVHDCYNANPDSMEKAVEFAGSVKISGKKIFVLGSMLELGEESCEAHKKAGLEAVKGGADMIVFVGKEMLAGYEAAKNCGQGTENLRLEYFENHSDEDMKAVCKVITDFALPGDFILLKASHSIALDRLVPLLNGGGKA